MLCRQHLQSFSQAAQRYAAETQLSKRVGYWNKRLVPVLEAEEDREEFNIHSSAEKILQTVEGAIKDEGGKKVSERRERTYEEPLAQLLLKITSRTPFVV